MKNTITLKKNFEFKRILQKGKWFSGKYIRIYLMNNNNETENRIGFVVSKKSGNSVFRNRTRRIMKEAYYSLEASVKKRYTNNNNVEDREHYKECKKCRHFRRHEKTI